MGQPSDRQINDNLFFTIFFPTFHCERLKRSIKAICKKETRKAHELRNELWFQIDSGKYLFFVVYWYQQDVNYICNFMKSQVTDRQIRSKNIASLKLQLGVGEAITKWNKLASRSRNRYLRLKELFMTEIDYQKDLIIIRDNIKKPLLQAQLVSQIEANTMFANIEAMIQLSAQLKEELEVKFNKWNRRTTEIGKTMIKFSKFMLVYSDYFKNLASTQAKMKQILSRSEKAKQIEKRLSTQTKIVTFQDLISKPFQRPLKYHLILRDYQSKTPKDHPDMPFLKQAIECYHKVNQKNNVSMQNKQKDEVLIALDAKFGNIIEGNTRSYIAQFQAILIDDEVSLYLFSDLLILAYKGINSTTPPIRIYLDKYSHLERPGDGRCFVNRLYVYGKRTCVHLRFLQQDIRNSFEQVIGKVITDINLNEAAREQKINERNRSTRNTLTQRRTSFTQLKPMSKRPYVISVIGNDQRVFSEDRSETYFVLEITATPSFISQKSPPRQVALVSYQTILKLVQLTKRLYPDLLFYPIDYCPRGFNPKDLQKDRDKRFQIQNIFVQLMLNTIYRNANTTKRLDIYSYYLNFSDTIWEHLRTPNTCALESCQACFMKPKFKNYEEYFNESRRRYLEKYQLSNNRIAQNKGKLVLFCDRKTTQMIEALQQIPILAIANLPLEARLQWLKSRCGCINHIFTNPKPTTIRINVKVYFCNVLNSSDGIQVEFASSQRVKQVLNYISERLKINLEDYTIVAEINRNSYLLWEDEQLGKVLIAPPKQQGYFSSFFTKQPYKIFLWLRKIWYFPAPLEIRCSQRKLQHKTEQLIFRVKYGEIKLKDLREYCRVYAWYYCFKHFIELDTLSYYLVKKRTEELDKMLPERMREKIIDGLYAQIEKIKANKNITHQNQLAEMIVNSILVSETGSCFFYDTVLKPDNIRVKIGCDAEGIKVRDKSNLLFHFKFSSPSLVYYTNGFEFVVSDEKTYSFYSYESWKLKKQADLYRVNYESFKV